MRSLAGVLLIYALSMLLASTSPVGTGQGVHQFQLVDELVPHVHIVNGQPVLVGGAQPQTTTAQAGTALGAAAGAGGAASVGVMLTPRIAPLAVIARAPEQRLVEAEPAPPRGRTEAPPVPPPLVQS